MAGNDQTSNGPGLEAFVRDWYWDETSHEFAREAGALLLRFVNHLRAAGLSEDAIELHRDNAWLIGAFLCQYESRSTFTPAAFLNTTLLIDDFRLRMNDFKWEVASYKETYQRLVRYIRAFGYGDDE